MIILDINRDESELINETLSYFPEAQTVEIDSFGIEPVTQLIIPLVAIVSPAVTSIVKKLVESKNVKIKYKGIEVEGDYRKVETVFRELLEKENNGRCV